MNRLKKLVPESVYKNYFVDSEWHIEDIRDPKCSSRKTNVETIAEYLSNALSAAKEGVPLREEVQSLRDQIERHEAILKTLLGVKDDVEVGDFENWLNSADSVKYQGQHVAFVNGCGVVDSAKTANMLWDKIKKKFSPSEVILGFVAK